MTGPARARGSRVARWRDAVGQSFAFPAAAAMIAGLVGGFTLPILDDLWEISLPVMQFARQESVRALLATIATATLSVAGVSFSVTITAFALASTQLSPRVLRTFRTDRLSQLTLAALLGTSIYSVALLVRLGTRTAVPNLSTSVAVSLAVASFLLFAAFIAHIVKMLQPASIVSVIARDARDLASRPYPADVGRPADESALTRARTLMAGRPHAVVCAEQEGYVKSVSAADLLDGAAGADGLVRQRVQLGEYVLPGDKLADVWCGDGQGDALADRVRATIALGSERTPLQDMAFPVRQLSDIALKALSPGINDPTTAEAAMNALAATLARFAGSPVVEDVRVDEGGHPRLVAAAPDLNDLVRLGFEQVRSFAASYPMLDTKLVRLIEAVAQIAGEHGHPTDELRRQAAALDDRGRQDTPPSRDQDI